MISFEFVAEYFDELEADFQREYGMDLRTALYGDGPTGLRRLSALINGLTPNSATLRKMRSGGAQWGTTEELLATLCELVDQANRMYYEVHFDTKKSPIWAPIDIPRPYKAEEKARDRKPKKPSSKDEMVSFFGIATTSNSVLMTPETS